MRQTLGASTTILPRTLACAWIKRLCDDASLTEVLKSNYLKLLIYFLQMRKLDGPFSKHPSEFPTLSDFPKNQNLYQAIKELRKGAQPYSADFSGDLSTYVACQEIENFGVHCYYALSNDPLTGWSRFDESLLSTGKRRLPKSKEAGSSTEEKEKEAKTSKEESRKVQFAFSPVGRRKKGGDERTSPSWGSNLVEAARTDKATTSK
ncbi:uncharacterized protein LOC135132867 isoform X2 [Zophobas morio]|uniref:uncharacterized protein LOC135132867 isoform X2 n=1 Tax=Zophobas morio TaxID=2755281 RepID=UPI003083088C